MMQVFGSNTSFGSGSQLLPVHSTHHPTTNPLIINPKSEVVDSTHVKAGLWLLGGCGGNRESQGVSRSLLCKIKLKKSSHSGVACEKTNTRGFRGSGDTVHEGWLAQQRAAARPCFMFAHCCEGWQQVLVNVNVSGECREALRKKRFVSQPVLVVENGIGGSNFVRC